MLIRQATTSDMTTGISPRSLALCFTMAAAFLLPAASVSAEEILVFRDSDDLVIDGAIPDVDSYSPVVAVNGLDEAAVVWSDDQAGVVDTLMGLFSRDLTSLSDVVYVNDLFENTTTCEPRVVQGAENTFVITWSDNRSLEGLYDVYITCMNNNMEKLFATDIRVNEAYTNTNVETPGVTSIGDGLIAVCWVDNRQNVRDVYMRRFRKDGTAIDGRDFVVNPLYDDTNAAHPRISGDIDGTAVIVWSDDRLLVPGSPQDARNDIFARILPRSAASKSLGDWPGSDFEIQISDNDDGTDDAVEPAIAGNGYGLYVVAWTNQTSDGLDKHIHAAVITSSGERLTNEFQVDLAPSPAFTSDPAVIFLKHDVFLISWYDEREGGIIVGQLYDAAINQLVSPELVLTDLVDPVGRPASAPFSDRAFITTWPIGQSGDRDVLANVHFWDLLADLNVDARVSAIDLFRFAMGWQPKTMSDTAADFDVDGFVDKNDVRILHQSFRTNLADRQPLTFSAVSSGKITGKEKSFVVNAKSIRAYCQKARRGDQTKLRRDPIFMAVSLSGDVKSTADEEDLRLEKVIPVRSPEPSGLRIESAQRLRTPRSQAQFNQTRTPTKKGLFFFNGEWR
ncbi:MAG: hypothetical protein ABIH23_00365 [bacterium]